MRSPKCTNTIPPSGRAIKPIENVASDAIVPASRTNAGKKNLLKISAAADPKAGLSFVRHLQRNFGVPSGVTSE